MIIFKILSIWANLLKIVFFKCIFLFSSIRWVWKKEANLKMRYFLNSKTSFFYMYFFLYVYFLTAGAWFTTRRKKKKELVISAKINR